MYTNNKTIPQTLHDSPEFKQLLVTLLTDYAKLKKNHVDMITSPENMKKFEIAFTHPTFDSQNNYEFYEFIGDSTVNKSIVWYLQRRFPSLRNEKGVETFSQLKANLVSRKSLSSLAIKLDFWQFVRMTVEIQERNKIKVMEDIFEAFMGCLKEGNLR